MNANGDEGKYNAMNADEQLTVFIQQQPETATTIAMDRRSCSEKTAKKNNIVVHDFGEKMLGDELKEAYSIQTGATNSGENETWTADFKLQNGPVKLINPPSTSASSGRIGTTLPDSSSTTKEEDASRESHYRLVAILQAVNTIVAVLGFVLYSYCVAAAFGAVAFVATICTRVWQACAAQTTRYARAGRLVGIGDGGDHSHPNLQMATERSYTTVEVACTSAAASSATTLAMLMAFDVVTMQALFMVAFVVWIVAWRWRIDAIETKRWLLMVLVFNGEIVNVNAASAFGISGTGVVEGDASTGVLVADDQCITDGVGNYGDSESATITAINAGTLYPKGTFETESASYDYLTIQGIKYGGTTPPGNIVLAAGEDFTWTSDVDTNKAGFTLCLCGTSVPYTAVANSACTTYTADDVPRFALGGRGERNVRRVWSEQMEPRGIDRDHRVCLCGELLG